MKEKTEIQKLYDQIPSFKCIEGCYECCDNQIQYAEEEAERVGGFDYKGSRLCPHIKDGGCSVYENRAFICRIYGASEMMPCPHGCRPEKYLSEEETRQLVKKYIELLKAEKNK